MSDEAPSGYESLEGRSALLQPLDATAPGSELEVSLEPASESSLSLGYVVHRVCTRTTLDNRRVHASVRHLSSALRMGASLSRVPGATVAPTHRRCRPLLAVATTPSRARARRRRPRRFQKPVFFVLRRFSDFVWLRERLRHCWPGARCRRRHCGSALHSEL